MRGVTLGGKAGRRHATLVILTTSNGTYPVHERTEPPFSWRAILEIVQALSLAVVVSVILNLFVVQVTEVRGKSMEPTLFQFDRLLVSKLDYRLGGPQRGDVIVFNPPNGSTIPYVKRVIAVAGDTVNLVGGRVLVNGQGIDVPEAVGASPPQAPRITYPLRVPVGTVWTMGDNRAVSLDSRSYGPDSVEDILGKVILRFWPYDRIRFFEW